MKHSVFLITLSILALPTFGVSEDAIDVKGGFFGGKSAKTGFFDKDTRAVPKKAVVEEREAESWTKPPKNLLPVKNLPPVTKSNALREAVPRAGAQIADDTASTMDTLQQMLKSKQLNSSMQDQIDMLKSKTVEQAGPEEPEPAQKNVNDTAVVSAFVSNERADAPVSLSVLINAEPKSHLENNLRKLRRALRIPNITLGELYIVDFEKLQKAYLNRMTKVAHEIGGTKSKGKLRKAVGIAKRPGPVLELISEMELQEKGGKGITKLAKQLGTATSPTWVVRYKGIDHVFEGNHQPSHLFSSNGAFLPRDSANKGSSSGGIQRHDRRKGAKLPLDAAKFNATKEIIATRFIVAEGTQIAKKAKKRKGSDDVFTLPDIPLCAGSRARKEEVKQYTFLSNFIDMVFYPATSWGHGKQAKNWSGTSIPYSSKKEFNPSRDGDMLIAGTLGIECLPTRVRFVSQGNKRYREYREGDSAWE